eukprot:scaffold4443_cov124-Skeletonema_marinoi.AAC.1
MLEIISDTIDSIQSVNIPTTGTGLPDTAPGKTAGGQEIPAVDLSAHVNMVTDAQNLTRDNILKYAGFFHGGINDGLEVSPKLAQRSL